MTKAVQISFAIFLLCLTGVWALDLETPLLTVLFSYFALRHLKFFNRKWISICLFLLLVLGIFSGFAVFLDQVRTALPKIIRDSIPVILDFAKERNIELPFNDLNSLMSVTVEFVQTELGKLANFASVATKEFILVLIGLVVAVSVFIDAKIDLATGSYQIKDNMYTVLSSELGNRFAVFYESFSVVMGAQIIIAAINTSLTGILILCMGFPYFTVIIVLTFLCGLLPIIGNLVSNTIIFAIAIKISLYDAFIVLVFLIAIHKLEYFLNSKIIGDRIKNPMWLTLVGLIVGQAIMGIPGMILAPVVLYYMKIEGSQIDISAVEGKA